jgi:hypothetical protein
MANPSRSAATSISQPYLSVGPKQSVVRLGQNPVIEALAQPHQWAAHGPSKLCPWSRNLAPCPRALTCCILAARNPCSQILTKKVIAISYSRQPHLLPSHPLPALLKPFPHLPSTLTCRHASSRRRLSSSQSLWRHVDNTKCLQLGVAFWYSLISDFKPGVLRVTPLPSRRTKNISSTT